MLDQTQIFQLKNKTSNFNSIPEPISSNKDQTSNLSKLHELRSMFEKVQSHIGSFLAKANFETYKIEL